MAVGSFQLLDVLSEGVVRLDFLERHLCGVLLGFLFGVARTCSCGKSFYLYLRLEHGVVFVVDELFDEFERYFHLVLLAPFDELRFEVHLLARHLLQVDVVLEYLLLHELLASVVPLVEVDGTDEGLERVTIHVAVVRGRAGGILHELVQPDFHGQLVERFALYDLGAGVGQEAFALAFEVPEDDVAHDCIENGVAQELQAFVVQRPSLFRAERGRLVEQGLLVDFQVAGKEAQDAVETKIRLPFLVEQEPYSVYLVT